MATDDVWTEHVRWRPECEYLRAVKGDHFIRETQMRLGMRVRIATGVFVGTLSFDTRIFSFYRSIAVRLPHKYTAVKLNDSKIRDYHFDLALNRVSSVRSY